MKERCDACTDEAVPGDHLCHVCRWIVDKDADENRRGEADRDER